MPQRRTVSTTTHDTPRLNWERSGPCFTGCDVSNASFDCRDASLWAAVNNGEVRVYRSPDLGRSRDEKGAPLTADLVWHVEPGRPDEPESVYAGVMPAALFRLRDGGDTWQTLAGDHPGVRSVNVAYAD